VGVDLFGHEHWEKPPATGRIPANRTDSGVFLTAEFLGARSCIFVKDERGALHRRPEEGPGRRVKPRITAQELLDRDLNDVAVERVVLEHMLRAKHIQEVRIINGLVAGNLLRALDREHVGTVIEAP
jgi:molybdenum storage protein